MWTYQITTGELLDAAERFVGTGYSGAGLRFQDGRNNPAFISDADVGPIPPGFYKSASLITIPQKVLAQ